MRSPRAGRWCGRRWRPCSWCRSARTRCSPRRWWCRRNRCSRSSSSWRPRHRGPFCGAMVGVRSICHPGPGWRSAAGRCRSCSHGCRHRIPPAGASPTGWWPSSACPWRAGAVVPGRTQASMLEEVRITGLGVIDDAVLELSAGFTALTGETGAGKTMVVTALGLLFGGRADPARVRPGAARAAVEGRLLVTPEVAREVEESGGELDEDGTVLVLSRSVSAEGRSRAFAGGRSVPVSLLQVLADDLVAVHGQADQQQLLKPGRQRDALDRFGGPELAAVLSDYRRVFARHRAVREELDALTLAERERAAEAEALRLGLAEIEAAAPVVGEDASLLAEDERLSNADALHAAAAAAHEALAGDPATSSVDASDVLTLLGLAARAIRCWPGWPAGCPRRPTSCPTSLRTWPPTPSRWTPTRPGWPRCKNAGPRWAGWSGPTVAPPPTSPGSWTGPSRPGCGWPTSRATPTRSRPWPRR